MEYKFIKLDSLNHANPKNDTPIHIRTDLITVISEASLQDKNQREEIESIVQLVSSCYAVRQTPNEIMDLIKDIEI